MALTQTAARHGRRGSGEKKVNIGKAERWLSMVGGGMLALYGLTRRSRTGKALAVAGSSLFYRGKTGHSRVYNVLGINRAHNSNGNAVEVEKAVTVNRPPQDVYNYWRNLENLANFMENVESVKYLGNGRSHWVVKTPLGTRVEWDAEVTKEIENEEISWHSVPAADIENEGTVRFKEAPGGSGTEVTLRIRYYPPAGAAGAAAGKLLGAIVNQQVANDLKRLKQVMETGEQPAAAGQPSGSERQ